MPKRKFAECGSDGQEEGESEDSNCSSIQTDGSTDVAPKSEPGPFTQARKKAKKSVSFQGVTVYYFPRKQGFTCVPSQGGSTLGMSEKHHGVETFSLSEYSVIQRQIHNQYLLEQHQQGKIILPPEKLVLITEGSEHESTPDSAASEDEDDDLGLDDDYYFLQPVPTRQRRVMLRQSGIKKIEPVEKDECKDIRSSREVCGCNCKVFCDPDTCICSKAGIKCQVDRLSFPCGCSKDGCANVNGRIEFNPIRVRTHFLHTLMRIEFEKKKGQMLGDRGGILKPHKLAACQVKQDLKIAHTGSSSQVVDAPCKDSPTCSTGICPSGINNSHSGHTGSTPQTRAIATRDETDLIQTYNSNERGSCRDCQKSDISELIMRESQFTAQSAELESCMGASNRNFTMPEEPHIGLPTVTNAGESLPQLMMFSDDEEAYNAENNAAMFQFPKEESSYSESSDCSSEGAGSVEEQPIYRNYHNFPGPYQGAPENPQCNNRVSMHTRSRNTSGQALEGICDYRQENNAGPHRTSCAAEQKYDLSNPTANGYKLEPISEILTPLRYPGYPPNPAPGPNATTGHWGPEGYCPQGHYSKPPVHGAMVGPAGDCSSVGVSSSQFPPCTVSNDHLMAGELNHGSQFMYTTTCQGVKPTESMAKNSQLVNGDTQTSAVTTAATNLPYSSPTHYASTPQSLYNGTESSVASSKAADTTEESDDKPKYHELKSSSKPSANSSLAYLSTANQVTASFDLTNHNTPSTATFHLGSNCSSAQPCANGMSPTGPVDLYGLPRPQTAQPVTTFELPNITTETEGPEVDTNGNEADLCSHRSQSPSCDQSATTQNFGEIIKESIVETVSA